MCTDTTVKGKGTATKTSKKKSTVASMRKSIAPSVITIEGIPYTAYFTTNVGYIYFDPTYFYLQILSLKMEFAVNARVPLTTCTG